MKTKGSSGKRASQGRMPQSRPPLERMMRIHQEIQKGGFPNATSLARDLEVIGRSSRERRAVHQEKYRPSRCRGTRGR